MTVSAVQPQAQQTSQASSAAAGNVTVRSGDTLWAIARSNGVSLQALVDANPQIANPDLIFPDQIVNLPAGAARAGGTGGAGAVAPGGAASGNAYDVAAQYLGRNAADLRSDRTDDLPMNANVPSNVCCANFVSAVLAEAGQMPAGSHTDSVAQLNTTLRSQGWTEVSAQNARAGDVVIIQGGGVSHTEIYAGNGRMIGSNNVNADGSQRISENNLSWALDNGAKILRAPASVTGAGNSGGNAGSNAPVNGTAPSGRGSQAQLAAQAVQYFESKGWSHAQAAGLAANLQAESGFRPNAVGDGGQAYGIAQWHPDRQANFRAFAGHDIRNSSFAEQLAFVNHELRTTEASAGNRLRNATSASEAGSIVSRYYERPADASGEASRRGSLANQIAAQTR